MTQSQSTYSDLLKLTRFSFAEARIECGDYDQHAGDFLIQVLDLRREKLLLMDKEVVSDLHFRDWRNALSKRLEGVPLQYLVGYAWFWNSKFNVGPGVLIPRKETEHVVEAVLSLGPMEEFKVGELGSGSGNIGISVLQERPNWKWIGFESNPHSIGYLKQNVAALLPKENTYEWVQGDFFEDCHRFAPYDLIVSNPPYIRLEDLPTLSREVLNEPLAALSGGNDGLEVIERLIKESFKRLQPNGILISEMAFDQAEMSRRLALGHGFCKVDVLKDMAGLDRVLIARKRD